MVNTDNVSFPITIEEFTALQRAEMGREPSKMEKEFFAEIVGLANDSFNAAAHGDADTVQDILSAINAVPTPTDYEHHLSALCRGWVLLGCLRGMEILKAAIDGTIYS